LNIINVATYIFIHKNAAVGIKHLINLLKNTKTGTLKHVYKLMLNNETPSHHIRANCGMKNTEKLNYEC